MIYRELFPLHIMPITNLREVLAPIKIKQCSLKKVFSNLPKPKNHSLLAELEKREVLSSDGAYRAYRNVNGA